MDPDYAGYRTDDTPAETAERIMESIGRGMTDALGELVLSPDELVVAAGMAALDANTRGSFGKAMLILLLGFTVKDMYYFGY